MRFHSIRRSSALIAVLFLGGCSQLKLGYGFLDTFIEREFNKYFDLNTTQSSELEDFADTYKVWHKGAMVPKYAKLLRREIKIHETGAFSRATFDVTRKDVDILYRRTVRPVIPQVLSFLKAQDETQLQALVRKSKERVEEAREEAKERTLDKSLAKLEENFAELIGELTEDQKAVIREKATPFFDGSTSYLDERVRRNEELIALLRSKKHKEAERFMTAWWLEPLTISPPPYRARMEKMLATIDDIIFEVLARMTPTQREQLVSTLKDYAEDLEAISS